MDRGGRHVGLPTPPLARDVGLRGDNPDGWIFHAEHYFFMNRLSDSEKLEVAVVCLDGDALAWYQWEESRRQFKVGSS